MRDIIPNEQLVRRIYDEIIRNNSWLDMYGELNALDAEAEKDACTLYFSMKSDVLFRVGKYHDANESIIIALSKSLNNSDRSAIYVQQAGILYSLKKYDEAIRACEDALKFDAGNALASIQKNSILMGVGRYHEAFKGFTRLAALNNYQVEFNKVSCLYYMGRIGEAVNEIARVQKKFGFRPEIDRLNSAIAMDKNDYDAAEKIVKSSLKRNPNYIYNWIFSIKNSRTYDAANTYWRQAVNRFGRVWPLDLAKINFLMKVGEYEMALAELNNITYSISADEIALTKANIYYEIGDYESVSKELGLILKTAEDWRVYELAAKVWLKEHNYPKAELAITNALKLSKYDVHLNYIYAKILDERNANIKSKEILKDISYLVFGSYDESNIKIRFENYINSIKIYDWSHWDHDIDFIKKNLDNLQTDDGIFYLHATPGVTGKSLVKIIDNKSLAIKKSYEDIRHHLNFRYPQMDSASRIRLGFLSMDFRNHAVSVLMAKVFEEFNKSDFELHAFSYGPDDGSSFRKRIERAFEYFHECRSLSDIEIAKMINHNEIDVLIDLAGFTKWNRAGILAMRPARVIVHAVGYVFSMGKDIVDFNFSDPMLSENNEGLELYSENVINLPWLSPADNTVRFSSPPSKESQSLPENKFIFCSFNQAYKLNPYIFDIWMEILKNCPESVLWLLSPNDIADSNIIKEATARGIDKERIIFARNVPLDQHYARLQLADLALDTTPYGSNTTSVTALWCGVPVLAYHGETISSRGSSSNLHAFGLDELIVKEGSEEYIRKAVYIYSNPQYHHEIKQRLKSILANGGGNLFDAQKYTRNFEIAIKQAYAAGQRKTND